MAHSHPRPDPPKIYTGSWIDAPTIQRLDAIAREMHGTRAQALRHAVECALAGQPLLYQGRMEDD